MRRNEVWEEEACDGPTGENESLKNHGRAFNAMTYGEHVKGNEFAGFSFVQTKRTTKS
jgi:hypothetical protein